MLGQVATMIENLHLSYDEVVNRIPLKTLVIMQKDKVNCVSGDDVVIRMSGKDFASRRMARNNNKPKND